MAPTFWILPAAVVFTTSTIVADSPTPRAPIAHVTVVVPLQLPCVVVTETKVSPAGNVSLNATPVAKPGPCS